MTASGPREALWARAAACYLKAGSAWFVDASRCLERAGDLIAAGRIAEQSGNHARASELFTAAGAWAHAARIEEQRGSHARAAELFTIAEAWADAARCWLACDRASDAAACHERAGNLLEAGWVLAHLAAQPVAGRAIAERWAGGSRDQAAFDIVVSRCEAGVGQRVRSAQRLLRAAREIRKLPLGLERERAQRWALAVAEHLRRPDLSAVLHATAVSGSEPGAIQRWETWAMGALHDASGIPAAQAASHVVGDAEGVNRGSDR